MGWNVKFTKWREKHLLSCKAIKTTFIYTDINEIIVKMLLSSLWMMDFHDIHFHDNVPVLYTYNNVEMKCDPEEFSVIQALSHGLSLTFDEKCYGLFVCLWSMLCSLRERGLCFVLLIFQYFSGMMSWLNHTKINHVPQKHVCFCLVRHFDTN